MRQHGVGPGSPGGQDARVAFWTFVALLVVAFPTILFGLGSYRWFFGDDFAFLTRRAVNAHDLFQPYNGHWTTIPLLAFRALHRAFGIQSYRPYQAGVIALHLAACALLRTVMRRSEVDPWVSTVAAGSFVFFGPGYSNIIWAFQMSLTGSLAFGLAQLVLGNHDGPIDWRDALGVVFGLLALASSGLGVVMALVTGAALLGRRGWKAALVNTAPLAVAYVAWWSVEHPRLTSGAGRPPTRVLVDWLWNGAEGVFDGLGHYRPVAILLVAVLVVGLALAWTRRPWSQLRRYASTPAAMLLGGVIFGVSSAQLRWTDGAEFARGSRYLHIGAALALPVIAVAVDALVERRRILIYPLAVLLLVAVPANFGAFAGTAFGKPFMDDREHIVATVVRIPEARQVPRSVHPIPDRYTAVSIGFLLDELDRGTLQPSTGPLTRTIADEMKVRVGVERNLKGFPVECRIVRGSTDIDPPEGASVGITGPVSISIHDGGTAMSRPVVFAPGNRGAVLTFRLAGLHLHLVPTAPNASFGLCDVSDDPAQRVSSRDAYLRKVVGFAVTQSPGGPMQNCRDVRGSTDIRSTENESFGFQGTIQISVLTAEGHAGAPITFASSAGSRLTIRSALHLRLAPAAGGATFRLCPAD